VARHLRRPVPLHNADMSVSLRPPVRPVSAAAVPRLPGPAMCRVGAGRSPRFDGWRAVAFVGRGEVFLQSLTGRPLHRYFPDVMAHLAPGTVMVARVPGRPREGTARGCCADAIRHLPGEGVRGPRPFRAMARRRGLPSLC
jgi:hypothetical protein